MQAIIIRATRRALCTEPMLLPRFTNQRTNGVIKMTTGSLVVIHKKTGKLAEMTKTWMGFVIWLVEFDDLPKDTLCIWPHVLYDDDVRFQNYELVGGL